MMVTKNDVLGYIKANPGIVTGGAVAAAAVIGLGTAAVIRSKNKKRKSKRTSKARKKRYTRVSSKRVSRTKKRKGQRYTPHTAGKRRDRSMKRIRYTKNGQPYVIMASGKARFIKKKSAKTSRKRTGGRY